ncbi:MAG: hypothetical protein ACJZ83_12415 [Pseudohongiellaceae bacterium]|tara:strand:+ start:215 stop:676 length:462 start_codon:yes stop_codon:yes gene_type:complete
MKISAINEGVSLIANIGVIGSIVFLGLEMQQNTEMMQSQTRNSIVENQLSFYERGIENSEIGATRDKINLDLDVEATERFQYTLYIQSQLRMWENEFYQYQIGLFDSDEFEARTNTHRDQLTIKSNVAVWERYKHWFAPDFRIYMNELLDEIS